ncbi:MAG: BPL-N domain-containing protein [Lentisphaerota bacterium]
MTTNTICRHLKGELNRGMISVIRRTLAFLLVLISLTVPVIGLAASQVPVRVAVYVDHGACGDKILALFRALNAAGCQPLGIETNDIVAGRLNKNNFDVFLLPAGEDASATGYWGYDYLGNYYKVWPQIQKFVYSGGGIVGIEAGASFLSSYGISAPGFVQSYPKAGLQNFTIMDGAFGNGSQSAYMSAGGGYFRTSKAVTVASDTLGRPTLIRYALSKGRVVLCAFDPELRGDSELDWTIWDNWDLNGVHPNSEGCWILLGRMIRWAALGDTSAPVIKAVNPTGARVAFVSTHTANGGAAASLQPALARGIEFAGHIPLAIRLQDICDGRLTTQDFKVVTFPGGTVAGYSDGLWGHEKAILDFVFQGGSYYGVCGGAYYASRQMIWEGVPYYDGPLLGLFAGTDNGPLTEIATWPNWAMTPVRINDSVLGDMGTQQQMYYGGGWKSAAKGVSVAATYTSTGHAGAADGIRFSYGNGRVFLTGTHPEARPGSNEDWLYWDKWAPGTNTPVAGPDNTWTYMHAIFNKWLVH